MSNLHKICWSLMYSTKHFLSIQQLLVKSKCFMSFLIFHCSFIQSFLKLYCLIFRKKELIHRIRADINSNSALFGNIKVNEVNHKIMVALKYMWNTRLCNLYLQPLSVSFVILRCWFH